MSFLHKLKKYSILEIFVTLFRRMAGSELEKALLEVLNPKDTRPNAQDLNIIASGSHKK